MTEFKQIIGRGTDLEKTKASGIWKSLTSVMQRQNSKILHLMAIRNRQKEVVKSQSLTKSLILQKLPLCLSLMRNMSSMVKIFVLLMR